MAGTQLYRIHRTSRDPLHFARETDAARRQRWASPDASYGVCYLAFESRIAFCETMLRDLSLETLHREDLDARSLAVVTVIRPLRLVEMSGRNLRRMGADASVVHGSYEITWEWSAALHGHADAPDGIRYRARHDDSGFSLVLFERARRRIRCVTSTPLGRPSIAGEVAGWLDAWGIGLTT